MTQEAVQNGLRNSSAIAEELTVRLGAPFSELCAWAAERELELPLELTYRILGLDPNTVAIANLVQELNHPESQIITNEWNDHPIVHELKKFSKAFAADTNISRKYASIGHSGGVTKTKKQFKNLENKTFLLTLITNPMAGHGMETSTIFNRRRLRIWLLTQAATRLMDHGCSADKSISYASRFLIIGAQDPRWEIVDELLTRVRRYLGALPISYERFNIAIENASGFMKSARVWELSYQKFLKAILRISRGSCRAIESSPINSSIPTHLAAIPSPVEEAPFGTDDNNFNVLSSLSNEDEGAIYSYISEVDPTDSVAQQALSSGSVFIQTTELSHYLPWSWDRLLPPEIKAVEAWVSRMLALPDFMEKVGSALVWIAMTLSRSLAMTERLTVEQKMTAEWSLTPDFQFLKRKSPRRHSSWQPDEATVDQVAAFRDNLTIAVPEFISDALKFAIKDRESPPGNLDELWKGISAQRLETWFNEQAKANFPRISSAKLAYCRGQQFFDLTGNFNFSRLLTSHPNSALPGACSYATWDISAIEKGLGLSVQRSSTESKNTHVMGSLLAPIESVLNHEIECSNDKLKQAFGQGLINYHNALTQYVVMALYAATGARPLRDPFESARHFSIQYRCVYINDKNDEGLHNGRLVPLPEKVIDLLAYYQNHLSNVSQNIMKQRPDLAWQMSQMADGLSANVPFFFLLDENLRWHQMSDAHQLRCALFEWSLPDNLFRHRYSQRLLKEGVDPEVIEGWMGHAERGSATYSDYSARCWADDANNYRDLLDHTYAELPFAIPEHPEKLPPLLYIPAGNGTYSEPTVFGQRARSRQRKQRFKAALREARADIELFLNNRAMTEISDEDLLQLSNRMVTRENRLPHPQAALRFRVLSKLVKNSVADDAIATVTSGDNDPENENKPPPSYARRKMLNKRLVNVSDEQSLVSQDVTIAFETYPLLSKWAEKIRKFALKASLSRSRALCVGAVLLAVEKRLGYKRLLLDVVEGKHFRLVQNARHYYFEYSETLESEDFSAAIQRHEISYKTASLLTHGKALKTKFSVPSPNDIDEFKELLEIYHHHYLDAEAPSMEELLTWLCRLVNQANLIQLPGIVAASLSERSPPTSASLRDFIRIVDGRTIDLPSDHAQNSGFPLEAYARARAPENNKLALQINAKAFTRAVTDFLNGYKPSNALGFAKELKAVCDAHRGNVSSSVLMIGYWISDMSGLGKGKRRKKLVPYAQKTLTTYWSSLSPAFRGFMYKVDLVNLDSDEVTELCAQMLDYKYQTSKSTEYFGQRLKEFFRWASRFGVESPEWDELNIDSGYRTVSPGLITEMEYQSCQDIIQSNVSLEGDHKLFLSFVLLLTYRFGLRANEAISLLRRDWCEDDQFCWVLVRNHQYRSLKSTSSRRAVPLLFPLSEKEQDIISQVIARYASIAGTQTNRPILCEASEHGIPTLSSLAPRVSEALIKVLRNVTSNPHHVLHHCRHSFYNRLAPALFDLNNPLAAQLSGALEHSEIRKVVLGQTHHVSKRSAMALGRLMGHQLPSTGLKNYCHIVTDWSDALTPVVHQRARKMTGVIQISELPTVLKVSEPRVVESLSYTKPSLTALFQTLRLVGLGMTYERAGALIKIHPQYLTNLQRTIENANKRMRFSSPTNKKIKLKGIDCPNALLEYLSDAAWQRLIHQSEQIKNEANGTVDYSNSRCLDDLPYLTSPNRHLLMDLPSHSQLVNQVIKFFRIPSNQYQVVAKNGSIVAIAKMKEAGFDVKPEHDIGTKLDGLPMYINERRGNYRAEDYGGLIFQRSRQGIVRNSLELAVAFLATGVFLQTNTPSTLPD